MQLRWLTRRYFFQWVVHPIICRIDLVAEEIIDAIKASGSTGEVDKRSKTLPLIFVQDVETKLTLKGVITSMRIRDDQRCRIEFGKPVDKKGNPAQVQEGSVSISITDDSATFVPDPDNPFAGDVVGAKPTADITQPGAVVITADADLGDGVSNITGSEPLIVDGGLAVGFAAPTVGTPVDQ